MSGDASSPGDAPAEPPPARVPQEPVRTKPARPFASDGAPPPAEAGDSPRALPAEAPASTEAGADAPEDPRGHLDALGAVALDRDPLESDASAALTSMAAAAGRAQPSAWSRNRDNTCPVDGCAGVRVAPAGSNRLPLTCASHAGVLSLLVGGVPSRGCQACRAFHPVEHFQRGNKTCEDRLKWKKMRYHEKTAFASGISGSAPRKRGRPPKSVRSADEIRSDAEAAEAAAAAAAAALAAASASTERRFSAAGGGELRGNAHASEDANASEARRRAMMRAIVDANSNADANEAVIRATGGAGAGAGALGWNALAGFGSGFGAGLARAEDARVAALIASTSPTEPADVRDVSAAAIAKHLGLGDLTNDAGGDTEVQEAAARSAERARTLLRQAHDLELRASAALELAQRRAAGDANIAGLHGSANGAGGGGQLYGGAQDGCRVM